MDSKEFQTLNMFNISRLHGAPNEIMESVDKVIMWMIHNNVHMIGGLVPADIYRKVVLEDAARECEKRITNEVAASRLDNEASSCARDIRVLKNK